jgi:exonuclease III
MGGVRKKSDCINYLYCKSIDIACIQESQLSPRTVFNVKGYSMERMDSDKPGKWGVLALLKAGINYTRAAVPDGVQAGHLVVDRPHAPPFNIVNVYAPPSLALPVEFLKNSCQFVVFDFIARF